MVEVMFYEQKRDRKSWFFRNPQERIWERWRLSLKPILRQTDALSLEGTRQHVEQQVRSAILYVATEALEGAEAVPALTATAKPFPYRIVVAGASNGPESLVGLLRRMVTDSSSAPPLLG